MKKNIALLTGGFSGEAVISYKSAATIQANLDPGLYNVYLIDIRKEGWWHTAASGIKLAIDKNDFTLTLDGVKIFFDVVFICIHGTPGEDGKLQGYFDTLGIPYTSCDAATSAITFNKRYTVAVAAMAGIAVARSYHIFRHSFVSADAYAAALTFPVFVKPNNGGSSIGMSKVADPADLPAAVQKAFGEDDQVLIEQMVKGREFTVGVYRSGGNIHVLPFTEVICDKDFFDFNAKYDGKTTEITPAEVTPVILQQINETAAKIYSVFNCRGVIRIDFIYEANEQRPYMLEVNTIPGQSEASIIPQQVRALGMDLKVFYTTIVEEALSIKA
ncbi:MAG: D-alanine--D-alanine ligase [Terrimonas sp.]|nr:D-alanine--D-alanine ligase [Terrimonas sp.]